MTYMIAWGVWGRPYTPHPVYCVAGTEKQERGYIPLSCFFLHGLCACAVNTIYLRITYVVGGIVF